MTDTDKTAERILAFNNLPIRLTDRHTSARNIQLRDDISAALAAERERAIQAVRSVPSCSTTDVYLAAMDATIPKDNVD